MSAANRAGPYCGQILADFATFSTRSSPLREGGLLEALQIFIRPHAADLEPQVQLHDLGNAHRENDWRLIGGPAAAPLILRAEARIHDARLAEGQSLAVPAAPTPDGERLLYVFAGKVDVADITLIAGESPLISAASYDVAADALADLVLFTTDMSAPVFKGGMFSGNVLAA